MAEIVVNVDDLIGPIKPSREPRSPWAPGDGADDDDALLVEFTDCNPAELRAAYRKLWGVLLLMALRDRATSVHYHPWRDEGALSYIVDDTRYEMVPPPAEYAQVCVDTAREAFTAPAGFLARLAGGSVASGTVRLEVGGNPIIWDTVVWSTGPRVGVELFRITPLEAPRDPQ